MSLTIVHSNAMEGEGFNDHSQAVEPVELGPSSAGEILTDEELAAWLRLPVDPETGRCVWVEKNALARRIPGQFKAGRYRRYRKDAILRQILKTGRVLLEKPQK